MFLSSNRSGATRLLICQRCSHLRPLSPGNRPFATTSSKKDATAQQKISGLTQGAKNGNSPKPDPATTQLKTGRAGGFTSGLKGLRNKSLKSGDTSHGGGVPRMILGQSADKPIRARFAPSPTGYLHLGSLRTALFNNLTASASKGGAFILRIEDTDQSRLVADAEERLLQDLKWAGLSWDEGPDCGGPHGPYRQSERLHIYNTHLNELLHRGHAYRCFCPPSHLESQKRALHEAGKPTVYPGTCRSVEASESERRAANGEPHVVRFRSETFGRPKLRDAIYGPFQKKDGEEDFILMKTDGFPTYHFANVVDDHLMEITHVIRGEEWLISTPKHVALYEAFGWTPPTFAHLGLLVNPDGSKLSKRNDSVNLSKYKDDGVFPMALLAWLANLGSSFKRDAGTPRSVEEVADALTFKFTRGGIKLNLGKLDHFNVKYRDALLQKPLTDITVTKREDHLIDDHLIQPTLQQIDAITTGKADINNADWTTPLELIPNLTPSSDTRGSYIRNIFTTRSGGFQNPTDLVRHHPYLFWRVPTALYRRSLAASLPDVRILRALEQAINSDDCWDDVHGTETVQDLRSRLGYGDASGVDEVPMHNTLRIIGAGGQDVISQSSSRLLGLLGRSEWRHRLGVVQGLLNEMKGGGLGAPTV